MKLPANSEAETNRLLTVVKLGGSLFRPESADVRRQVNEWLCQLGDTQNPTILVVGGGQRVDNVRALQAAKGWDDWQAHWAAIAAMRENARKLAGELDSPVWKVGGEKPLDATNFAGSRHGLVVAVLEDSFLRVPEIPCSWDVTSDSISLWLAGKIRAKQLILAKRVRPLEPILGWGKIRGLGWVDPYFGELLKIGGPSALVGPSASRTKRAHGAECSGNWQPPEEIWIRHFCHQCSFQQSSNQQETTAESPIRSEMGGGDRSQTVGLQDDTRSASRLWTRLTLMETPSGE